MERVEGPDEPLCRRMADPAPDGAPRVGEGKPDDPPLDRDAVDRLTDEPGARGARRGPSDEVVTPSRGLGQTPE